VSLPGRAVSAPPLALAFGPGARDRACGWPEKKLRAVEEEPEIRHV
jgi:hypothetical protein